MSLLNDLITAAGGAGRVLRIPDRARRRALLLDYLRVQFRYLVLYQVFGRRMTCEHLLGYELHFHDYQQFAIVFGEIFVPEVYYFSSSRPDPLIFDCGANIGMSVLYFKWIYPQARIVAFEPDPGTFEILKRNVEGNRLQNVELHCEAVGGAPGSVPFHYLEGYPGWLTGSAVMRASAESKTRMVPMVTLSPLIHEEVDMLKVDTEGSEAATLAELEASGKLSSIRAMVLEYHHHMEPDDDALGAFLARLERNHFGYMLSAIYRTPFVSGEFEGLMIGAYRREAGQPLRKF